MPTDTVEVETKLKYHDIVVDHVVDWGPSLERIVDACESHVLLKIDKPLAFQTNRDIKLFKVVLTNKELRMDASGALRLSGRLIEGGWTFTDSFYNPYSQCGRFRLTLRVYDSVAA